MGIGLIMMILIGDRTFVDVSICGWNNKIKPEINGVFF